MTTLINDIKHGIRMLAKNPVFSLAVILIIGLGVGANTAIFNALDQVALRSLPVKNPKELVNIQYQYHDQKGRLVTDGITHYPIYAAYRDQSDVFSDVIAFAYGDVKLHSEQGVQTIKELGVSGNYFTMLGIRPALGRLFNTAQEPDTVAHSTVVISHAFWQKHFDGKPDAVGKQLILDEQILTIVGVTPASFRGTMVGWSPEVYLTAGMQAQLWDMELHGSRGTWLLLMARLKPGITRVQAQTSLRILARHLKANGLYAHEPVINSGHHGWMSWETMDLPVPLSLFLTVALFILLIAVVNIANIQLSRGATRQKEMAIRQALGAGRWQVIRQLLIESLLLALAGSVFALVLAVGLDRILCVLLGRIGSSTLIPGLNLRVLFFGLTIALCAGFIFGLAPAFQILRQNITPALKESSNWVVLPTGSWNPHYLLAMLQMAMAVMVLTCAGLFVRSIFFLSRIDPGYDTTKLVSVTFDGFWRLNNRPDLRQFYYKLHERVKDLPGVEASCLANLVPLSEAGAMRGVTHIDGVEIPENERRSWWYGAVSPDYFKVLNMPLINGRLLTNRDNLAAPRVMVINDIMAQTYWPNDDPLGKVITYAGKNPIQVIIVGVVKATKMRSIVEGKRPIAYWPLSQTPQFTPSLLLRTTGDPRPYIQLVRQEVVDLGPGEVCHIRTVADRVSTLLAPQRTISHILNVFALAALLLCMIGIYSVMAYGVKQHTREIGIRMALGAEKRHVIKAVVLKGGLISATGIGLGLGLSLVMIRLLEIFLPGLQRWNKFMLHSVNIWSPGSFIVISLLVMAIALVACYIPARRAAKIDPMEALRCE